MLRVLVIGVIGAALIAAVVFVGTYTLCCSGDDDSASPTVGPTPTQSSVLVVTPTPANDEDAVIQYELKVVDWGEALRQAALTIAEKINSYGQDVTTADDLGARHQMFSAFDSIGQVRTEYNATAPPPSLATDHQKLGESLASFLDVQQSVTLGYAGRDAGKNDAAHLQFSDAATSLNKATKLLNEVLKDITQQ